MVVQHVFESLGHSPEHISLGEVETTAAMSEDEVGKLRKALEGFGFELIEDTRSRIIEKIKTSIVESIHQNHDDLKINYSEYIESQLNRDYAYLSSLFSESEGITIAQYIIHQKIERVKELLVYDELTLSEIADLMGYSNVAYLSNQFKKVTGVTPSQFKLEKVNKRIPLDEV